MAAFASVDDYAAAIRAPSEKVWANLITFSIRSGLHYSSWLGTGGANGAGVAPTTSVVPSRTIAGAIGQGNPASGELFVPRIETARTVTGWLYLCDRLVHSGGLSGTVTTVQTTNLPTTALTRYTSGVGVLAALEIYSAVGTTGTTFTCTYTNQAGTGSRVSPPITFGSTDHRDAGRFLIMPFQHESNDHGVRAVADVDLVASTGTAGNFGVTLFKPLLALPVPSTPNFHMMFDGLFNLGGQLPEIQSDACLFWVFNSITTAFGSTVTRLSFTDQ